MKLSQIININAIIYIALGIAFAINSPLILVFFGVSSIPSEDSLLYWQTASYARLYGAASFGFGLLLLSIARLLRIQPVKKASIGGILTALLFANAIGLFATVTQQLSIWQGAAGWVLGIVYAVFFVLYVILIVRFRRQAISEE